MRKDGGSAFPVSEAKYGYDGEYIGMECTDGGMSLRDWFAGQAMPAVLQSASDYLRDELQHFSSIASKCYELADAMLAEREKNNGQ